LDFVHLQGMVRVLIILPIFFFLIVAVLGQGSPLFAAYLAGIFSTKRSLLSDLVGHKCMIYNINLGNFSKDSGLTIERGVS